MSEIKQIGDIINDAGFVKRITPPPKNKIKKSRTKRKSFKFPIDLMEFPLNKKDKNSTEVEYRNKIYIVKDLKSLYGGYGIRTIREHKPMDTKTLLATLYFTHYFDKKNQFENKTFENKFTEWLEVLEIPKKSTGYYRKAIIEGLDYLANTTIYSYHAWNYSTREREAFKKGEDLPAFSVFHIINEFHHLKDKGKRKSKLRVEIGDTFYSKIQERYTYLELDKVLPLSDIALNLYMFIKKQYEPTTFVKIPYPFELFREDIGITDKNKTYARRTFDNAFKELKDKGLANEYDYDIEEFNGTDSISFTFVKSLIP